MYKSIKSMMFWKLKKKNSQNCTYVTEILNFWQGVLKVSFRIGGQTRFQKTLVTTFHADGLQATATFLENFVCYKYFI